MDAFGLVFFGYLACIIISFFIWILKERTSEQPFFAMDKYDVYDGGNLGLYFVCSLMWPLCLVFFICLKIAKVLKILIICICELILACGEKEDLL